MPKQLNIRQLLLLALLLAGLVPAMLISFLSFFQAKAALKKEITHDMQTLSQAVANDTGRIMVERVQNVHSWSGLSIMQEAEIDDVDKRLSIFLKELSISYNTTYRNIYVIDANRTVVASSNSAQIGQTIPAFKHWFNISKTGKNINIAEMQNNILPISAAIVNANGEIEPFMLIAEFDWKNIVNVLNTSAKNQTAAVLVSADKKILAHSTNWQGFEGRHSLHAFSAPLSNPLNLGWYIVIEKLHSVAVAPTDRLGWIFLALLITSIFFAALLVSPIAKMITAPLSQLTEFAQGFAQHKKLDLPTTGPTEVQTLSTAFTSMLQNLAQYEADLTRAAKLAVAGEMAAAMSHEIRTPLGILRSSAELLQRERHLSDEGREVLGFIISETERLNRLVNSLIDTAKPRQPIFAKHDVNQIINNCVALLASQARTKQIAIHYAPINTQLAELDVDQITQVIMNLLMNAIQILPQHGNIQVSLSGSAHQVKISVGDDGPGIAAKDQAHIFEPFFTQRAGGIGLGLAIVKQIVLAHHGEIFYEASTMQGAQFTIILPKHWI